ncbi:PREDICTED: uncharacterized protein LOC104821251 [Tarenaya hassleriana]|uniref:uncharacterized protein LOC104821251 n=1 Tax=Tarenaya hassleriana TaxID=28532 RepID=UPI00053C1EE3|nr:PREDICTED: uncharacterized protein LOC104821251 [Tarenaya hassleriana]
MREGSCSEKGRFDLLNQLEHVLESDPRIDEVGFIHPTQFILLEQEAGGSNSYPSEPKDGILRHFWNRDHKLGISTEILLPLYKAAKSAFMASFGEYKRCSNSCDEIQNKNISSGFSSSLHALECEVMKHSRALLLLSSDFATAWNARKLILSKKKQSSGFMDELQLSGLILSNCPKSEQTWNHRRWIIKMIGQCFSSLQEIVGKESELVEKIAERSKMNYRAWNHRCWLVSYMTTEQVLHELDKSKYWTMMHVADSSCFHYRRRLMLKILESLDTKGFNSHREFEVRKVWKGELEWNKELIERYVGREGLWFHRRFLSLCWMKYFAGNDPSETGQSGIAFFMENEITLLVSSSRIPDTKYEDFQAQALHAATYLIWLPQRMPGLWGMLEGNLGAEKLKGMMNIAFQDRPALLVDLMQTMNAARESRPDAK